MVDFNTKREVTVEKSGHEPVLFVPNNGMRITRWGGISYVYVVRFMISLF